MAEMAALHSQQTGQLQQFSPPQGIAGLPGASFANPKLTHYRILTGRPFSAPHPLH
jgi:hypothetical protein